MQPATQAPSDRIREALLTPPDKVDLDSIAQHFVKLAGGPGAIAKLLYDEYTAADDGSPVRARIMEMILRAFTKLEGRGAVLDDLSMLDDNDLERILRLQMSRLGVDDGHVGSPAAAEEKAGSAEKANTATTGTGTVEDPPSTNHSTSG